MQEEEDLGGIRVALCEGEEVEVIMANVEILEFEMKLPRGKELARSQLSSRTNL